LSELPEADWTLRAEIEARARAVGWPQLHGELARLDPETAARLKPTDAQRIQRALEVVHLTGKPLSRLLSGPALGEAFPYRVLPIVLMPGERTVLHRRIAERFQRMLEQGLIEEVEWLRAHYALSPRMPSMRCVGYRQVWQYLEGEIPRAALGEQGIVATRQLAKRQMTWLRAMRDAVVLDCLDARLFPQLMEHVSRFLEA
jgi:tRNA dimethylallyltransferase